MKPAPLSPLRLLSSLLFLGSFCAVALAGSDQRAAFGDRSRIADLRRTSISPPAAFGKRLATAAVGHNRSVTDFPEQPLKRPFHSETCRMAYERYSAEAAGGDSTRQRLQWVGHRT